MTVDWIDIENFDHDLEYQHVLVKTDEDKVYCGYFGSGCADGDLILVLYISKILLA